MESLISISISVIVFCIFLLIFLVHLYISNGYKNPLVFIKDIGLYIKYLYYVYILNISSMTVVDIYMFRVGDVIYMGVDTVNGSISGEYEIVFIYKKEIFLTKVEQ